MTTPDTERRSPMIGTCEMAHVTVALPPWLAPEVAAWVDSAQGRGVRFADATDAARAALVALKQTRHTRSLA